MYNKHIWYNAYSVRNSNTKQTNFARERQAAVQPTINAARKMFASPLSNSALDEHISVHAYSIGWHLSPHPPPPTHTRVHKQYYLSFHLCTCMCEFLIVPPIDHRYVGAMFALFTMF